MYIEKIMALMHSSPTRLHTALDTLDSFYAKELEMVERVIVLAPEDRLQLKFDDYR